jgi:hypothetical protein
MDGFGFALSGLVGFDIWHAADQPLADDRMDGAGNQERLDAHIEQTRQDAGRASWCAAY